MSKETKFSSTIKIGTDFDIKNILNGLQEIRKAFSSISSQKGQNALGGIDRQIRQLEDMYKSMQIQIGKGYSSSKDIETFDKNLKTFLSTLDDVKSKFSEIKSISLSDSGLSKSISDIGKLISGVFNTLQKQLTESLPKSVRDSLNSSLIMGSEKTAIGATEKYTKALQEQLEVRKQNLELLREEAKQNSVKKVLDKAISKTTLSDQDFDVFQLTQRLGDYGAQIREKSDKGTVRWSKPNTDFKGKINSIFSDTMTELLSMPSASSQTGIDILQKKLLDFGVIIKDQGPLLEKFANLLNSVSGGISKASISGTDQKRITTAESEIEAIESQIEAIKQMGPAVQEYDQQLSQLYKRKEQLINAQNNESKALNDGEIALQKYSLDINETTAKMEDYGNQINKTGAQQEELTNGFDRFIDKTKALFSIGSVFFYIRNQIQKTFQDVQELDKSFAQIAMVTQYEVNDLWESYDKYAEMANRLGQNTNDVIQASVLFYQQGLKTNEVLQLTEDTMKLATLAGTGFAEATDLMTAAIRGFNIEMDQGAHITDVYSELAAHAAADVQEIATAMNKTAAIAANAGMSFENTAAFLTQMIETTQESANNLGTAMKTVIARFTELKENVDQSGEDADAIEYNKVDKALKSVGVSLKDANGQFRDLDDVFLELASRWDGLSRNQQRYVATIAAGSRQQSRFIALMSNYKRTLELVEIAQESEGRSTEQFGKYADSIEYKLKQLQNTWEQFRVSLANNEVLSSVITLANNLLTSVTNLEAKDFLKWTTIFLTVGRQAGKGFIDGLRQTASVGINLFNTISKNISERTPSNDNFLSRWLRVDNNEIKEMRREFNDELEAQRSKEKNSAEKLTQKQSEIDVRRAKEARKREEIESGVSTDNGLIRDAQRAQLNVQIAETDELEKQLRDDTQEVLQEAEESRKELLKRKEDIDKRTKEIYKEQSEVTQTEMQAIGTMAATALTTAFVAVATQENPMEVALTAWKTTAITMIPQLISVFTNSLASGLKAGDALLATTKTGLIILGITAAISALAAAYKGLSNSINKTREENTRMNSSFYASQKQIEQLKEEEEELGKAASEAGEKYSEVNSSYKELTEKGKELKQLSEKLVLTNDEQVRFNELSNELAELFPSLIDGYDAENNAIINLTNGYQELVKAKEEELRVASLQQSKSALDYEVNQYSQKLFEYQGKRELAQKIDSDQIYQYLSSASGTEDFSYEQDSEGRIMPINNALARDLLTGPKNDYKNEISDLSVAGILYTMLRALSHSELEAYGNELKEILSGASFTLPDDNEDVIGAIREQILNDQTGEKVEEFKKAFDNYASDFNLLEKDLISSRGQLQNQARQYAGDYLSVNDDYYNKIEDKNVQRALQDYVLSQSGIDIEKIEEELLKKGLTGDAFFNAFSEKVNRAIRESTGKFDTSQFEVYRPTYEAISRAIESGAGIREISNIAYSGFGETDEYNNFQERYASQIEEYNENIRQIAEAFDKGSTLSMQKSGLYSTDDSIINTFMEIGSTAQQAFIEGFNKADATGLKDLYLKEIKELINSGVNLGEVFNYNWGETSYLTINNTAEYFKEKFGETNTEAILDFAKKFHLVDFSIPDLDEFKEQTDKAYSNLEGIINSYSNIIKNYKKNGYLSYSDIDSLEKAGFDVSKVVGKDLSLDTEALKEQLEYQINSQDELNNKVRQETLGRINTLEALKQSQNAMIDIVALQDAYAKAIQNPNGNYNTLENFEEIKKRLNEESSTAAIDEAIASLKTQLNDLDKQSIISHSKVLTLMKDYEDSNKAIEETIESVKEKYKKAQEDFQSKQQALIDKQKELNDVLYGTDTYQGKVDPLYNYQTALDVFIEKIEDAKDALEDLDGENPTDLISKWINAANSRAAYLTAENNQYNKAIGNTQSVLNNQLSTFINSLGHGINSKPSDFYSYNQDLDRYVINQSALNQAKLNDQLKDFIAEQVSQMNKYKSSIKANQDEIKKLDKDWEEYLKQTRDDYISVQDEIVEKLKESYQEQIDDKEDLYNSLKEADDNYLTALEEAINKQRELREQQNKWDDLATKERKLSLLQRDTSGAQRKDVMKLQQDIEKDRTSLLDDAVDNVVDELKELYETQQESRELEIQYQQNLLDNSNLIVEANAIMQSWKSMDDMVAWMYEHTKDIESMSDEAIEKLTDDWKEMFNQIQIYNSTSQEGLQNFYNQNAEKINNILITTSESLTNEANRVFKETSEAVKKSIADATNAVNEAMTSLTESQKALTTAQNEYTSTLKKFKAVIDEIESDKFIGYGTTLNSNLPAAGYDQFIASTSPRDWKSMDEIKTIAAASKATEAITEASTKNTILAENSEKVFLLAKQYKSMAEAMKSYANPQLATAMDNFLDTHKAYKIGDNIYFNDDAVKQLYEYMTSTQGRGAYSIFDFVSGQWKQYKKGGLVNYTGPAWVDGTKSKPEAFLTAEDTSLIGSAVNILSKLPIFSNGSLVSGSTTTVGDTNVELHIHVDSIATEEQVDYLINRIKDDIVDSANPIGTTVLMNN